MDAPGVPTWVRAALWALAIGLALTGVALAAASRSAWPLLALLGLAVPMVPIGMRGGTRDAARPRAR